MFLEKELSVKYIVSLDTIFFSQLDYSKYKEGCTQIKKGDNKLRNFTEQLYSNLEINVLLLQKIKTH